MKLTLIENKSRRKACYKKRKKGLIKKVEELTTLCGVEACLIIYSHFDSEPQIWPPEHSTLMHILLKFKNLSFLEQNRKMVTQESFTRQRIIKLLDLCKKLRHENRRKEIGLFVSECLAGVPPENFSLADLNEMRRSICLTIEDISRQIDTVKEQFSSLHTLSLMPNMETGFLTGYNHPVVEPEVPHEGYPQNPMRGMNMMVLPAGIANGYYQAVVAPEMPTNNDAYVYHSIFPPQMPVNNSGLLQNPTRSTNSVLQNQQSTGFPNAYFINEAFIPSAMVMNDPRNSTSGMNPVVPVPHNQSAYGSNETDWISYLFRGQGAGNGFSSP